jgi:hypothetical protein
VGILLEGSDPGVVSLMSQLFIGEQIIDGMINHLLTRVLRRQDFGFGAADTAVAGTLDTHIHRTSIGIHGTGMHEWRVGVVIIVVDVKSGAGGISCRQFQRQQIRTGSRTRLDVDH